MRKLLVPKEQCFVLIREQIDEETIVEGVFLKRKDAHDTMHRLVSASERVLPVDSCGPFWTIIKAVVQGD